MTVMKGCSVPGCDRPQLARGWCRRHYRRWYTHGDPNFTLRGKGYRLIAEALENWDRSGCWSWPFGKQHGYPNLNENLKVSHVVLEAIGQPKPFPAAMALHSCDDPGCWNPAHLRWGTHQQNMADMVQRRRSRGHRFLPGEACLTAKLSNEEADEIRRRYQPGKNQWTGPGNGAALAAEYGVTPDTIRKIGTGQKRAKDPEKQRQRSID